MKIEKKKLVFGMVLFTILLFLIAYSYLVMGEDETENEILSQPLVPELEDEPKEYNSKLDAINDLKEVRETNAPSIYDEKLMDSLGFYDPELETKKKERMVDSIYKANEIQHSKGYHEDSDNDTKAIIGEREIDSSEIMAERKTTVKELGLEHQLFFASDPKQNEASILGSTDGIIHAVVDGDQVVKANSRLRMRLTMDARINNRLISKNTPVFGFISFQPNRALIEIESINHHPTDLKAYDLEDGSEGIYVENSFRAEATGEVLDDIIQDINIPSVPQVNGIGQVLRRRNRNVKATILNNYKLILKPKL